MTKLEEYKQLIIEAYEELEKYDNRQSAAARKRIRLTGGKIKNIVTAMRKELVEADKA